MDGNELAGSLILRANDKDDVTALGDGSQR